MKSSSIIRVQLIVFLEEREREREREQHAPSVRSGSQGTDESYGFTNPFYSRVTLN